VYLCACAAAVVLDATACVAERNKVTQTMISNKFRRLNISKSKWVKGMVGNNQRVRDMVGNNMGNQLGGSINNSQDLLSSNQLLLDMVGNNQLLPDMVDNSMGNLNLLPMANLLIKVTEKENY